MRIFERNPPDTTCSVDTETSPTSATGQGTLVAPGRGKHSYRVIRLDASRFVGGGTIHITITVGDGESEASFDLYPQGQQLPTEGFRHSLATAVNVGSASRKDRLSFCPWDGVPIRRRGQLECKGWSHEYLQLCSRCGQPICAMTRLADRSGRGAALHRAADYVGGEFFEVEGDFYFGGFQSCCHSENQNLPQRHRGHRGCTGKTNTFCDSVVRMLLHESAGFPNQNNSIGTV